MHTRNFLRFLFLALFQILATQQVAAMERFDIVSTEQLEELLQERTAGIADFVLVNTLDELIFRHNAIPGSINIPWPQIHDRYTELGGEKNRLIITYCMGYR